VALTANTSAEDREACLGAGSSDLTKKPSMRERLSAALARGSDAALAA
jgi:CheY-like chemotaxis protein